MELSGGESLVSDGQDSRIRADDTDGADTMDKEDSNHVALAGCEQ